MSTIAMIAGEVARLRGVTVKDLLAHRRTTEIVRPRQETMYLAKRLTGASLPQIGRRLGNRDHTTVLHSARITEKRMAADPAYAKEVRAIEALVRTKLSTPPPLDEVSMTTEEALATARHVVSSAGPLLILDHEVAALSATLLHMSDDLQAAQRRADEAEARAQAALATRQPQPDLRVAAQHVLEKFSALEAARFSGAERGARQSLSRALEALRNTLNEKEAAK